MLDFLLNFKKLFQSPKQAQNAESILRASCYFNPSYIRYELKRRASEKKIATDGIDFLSYADLSDDELLKEYIQNRDIFSTISPSLLFNVKLYTEKHPEILKVNINPLVNYILDDKDIENYCLSIVYDCLKKRDIQTSFSVLRDSFLINTINTINTSNTDNSGKKGQNTSITGNSGKKDQNTSITSNLNTTAHSEIFKVSIENNSNEIIENKTKDGNCGIIGNSDQSVSDKESKDNQNNKPNGINNISKSKTLEPELTAVGELEEFLLDLLKNNPNSYLNSGTNKNDTENKNIQERCSELLFPSYQTKEKCIYTCYLKNESGIYPPSLINVEYYDPSCDYLCITDCKELLCLGESEGWRFIDSAGIILDDISFSQENGRGDHNKGEFNKGDHNKSDNNSECTNALKDNKICSSDKVTADKVTNDKVTPNKVATNKGYSANSIEYLSLIRQAKYNSRFLDKYKYACWISPDVSVINLAFYKKIFNAVFEDADIAVLTDYKKQVNIAYLARTMNLPVEITGKFQKPKVQNINFDVELFNLTKDYVKDFMDSMTGSKVLNFPELIAYHIYLPKYRLNVHEFSYHDFFDKDKLCIHKRYNLNEEDYVYIVDKHKYIDRDFLLRKIKLDISNTNISNTNICNTDISNADISNAHISNNGPVSQHLIPEQELDNKTDNELEKDQNTKEDLNKKEQEIENGICQNHDTVPLSQTQNQSPSPSLSLSRLVPCTEVIPGKRYILKDVIVSLTTFTPRVDDLVFVIYSILNNTYLPERVVLALSEEDFPYKELNIPSLVIDLLKKFQAYEILWVDNTRSYKKLIPALSKYSDKTIITIDDDIYYNNRFIENLMMEHVLFPNTVIASRGHLIKFAGEAEAYLNSLPATGNKDLYPKKCNFITGGNKTEGFNKLNQSGISVMSDSPETSKIPEYPNSHKSPEYPEYFQFSASSSSLESSGIVDTKAAQNRVLPYNLWKRNTKLPFASHFILPTGCGGILYPSGSLYQDTRNQDLFMKLAPSCDDLWFWAMSTLNGFKKKIIRSRFDLIHTDIATEIGSNDKPTLMKINYINGDNNDIQFRHILDYYPELMNILDNDVDSPLVSVIVPVYNASLFIRRCIDSLIHQTLKNIEIILVNDGSTDDSLNIIKEYEKLDSRIIVINQTNSGCNVSRNRGISIARGRYIGFVDSDDMVSPDYFAELYATAVSEEADITATPNIPWLNHEGTDVKNVGIPFNDGVFKDTKSVAVKTGTVWNKIYSRDLLKRYNIHFCEIPKVIGGDNKFTFGAMMFCNRLAVNTKARYYYYREGNSITNKKKSRDDIRIFKLYKEIETYIDDNPNLSEKDKNLWHQTLIKRLTRDLGFYLKELESDDDRKYYSELAVVNFPELETVFSNSTKEPKS
jgi:glycosyltransferase involved in cell wall biosynthesis